MATKSFTTEYKFTSKSVPKLLKAIEMQENPMSPIKRKSNNKFIVTLSFNWGHRIFLHLYCLE